MNRLSRPGSSPSEIDSRRHLPGASARSLSPLRPPSGPVGRLAVASLVTTVGNGLWYASWAIMFTRVVGLTPNQVALGITVGGVVGLTAGVPMGRIADRVGVQPTLVIVSCARALAMASYIFVHQFWWFLAVSVIAITANSSAAGVQVALVTSMTEGAERIEVLSYLRVYNSVGFAVGAGLAALALDVHTRAAFVAIVLFNAVTFLGYAVIVATIRGVRHVPATRSAGFGGYVVLRDRPYIVVTALTGVLALSWGMLSSGVPLWITHHTFAPAWTAALIVVINSLTIAVFQQRVSRHNDEPRRAVRSAIQAGLVLAVACAIFAAGYDRSGVLVVVILLSAGMAQVLGEMLFIAASWGLSIGLMPDRDHGQYQGMNATGIAAAQAIAPALLTALVVDWGVPGWFVLAALLVAAGYGTAPATRWALRSGPPRTGMPAAPGQPSSGSKQRPGGHQ